jgi:hypothetical protein
VDKEKVDLIFFRLRQLRKRLNLKIDDVAKQTGLAVGQIQRLEGKYLVQDNEEKYVGSEGRAITLMILLLFYTKTVPIDMLSDPKVPVINIPINKSVNNEIINAKIHVFYNFLLNSVKEVESFLD